MKFRPRILVERTRVERLLEIVGMAGVVFIISFLIKYWGKLPEHVPSHFAFNGYPDAYSGKTFLIILPSVSIFCYIVLTALGRYPHILNYIWELTPENVYRQYQLAKTMITAMKTEIVWIFNYIVYIQIRVSLKIADGLSPLFLPAMMSIVLATICLYFFFSYKER